MLTDNNNNQYWENVHVYLITINRQLRPTDVHYDINIWSSITQMLSNLFVHLTGIYPHVNTS